MRKLLFQNLNLLIVVVFMLYFASCTNKKDEDLAFFQKAIAQTDVDKKYDWIIVMPGLGCHGCIQEGEFFMKKNISNEKILFVLTNIESLKILQQKVGVKIKDHSNIYIDKSDLFKTPTDNAIYPCVIELKEGKIVKYEYQSPETAAFHNLKKYLAKEV